MRICSWSVALEFHHRGGRCWIRSRSYVVKGDVVYWNQKWRQGHDVCVALFFGRLLRYRDIFVERSGQLFEYGPDAVVDLFDGVRVTENVGGVAREVARYMHARQPVGRGLQ